ncbi:MAG: hypothetical protein AAF919_16505 [Pseudomonadota bacterium]
MSRHVWMDKIAEAAREGIADDQPIISKPSRPQDDVPFRTVRNVQPLRASSAG